MKSKTNSRKPKGSRRFTPAPGYEVARVLLIHAVSTIFDGCGNSYACAYTEQWLRHAKALGVYHGRVIGNIVELKQEWEDWLDENGGLPDWPDPQNDQTKP